MQGSGRKSPRTKSNTPVKRARKPVKNVRKDGLLRELAIEMSARGYSVAEIACEAEQKLKIKRNRVSIWQTHINPNQEEIARRRADLIENYKERIPIAKKEIRLQQLQDALEKARTGFKQIRIDKQGKEHELFVPDPWLADRIMRTIQAEIGEDASKIADGLKHSGAMVNVNVIGDYKGLSTEEKDRRTGEWVRFISATRVRGAMGIG